MLPQGKKKIKKRSNGKKSKKASKTGYFNSDVDASITEFQKAEIIKNKHSIYKEGIKPAFDKLVENLIYIHNYESLHDTYEDLKSDTVTFLYQTLPKYDSTKGFKAFSYFNVVAKNFLTIRSKQRSTRIKRNVSMDEPDSMDYVELETLREYCTVPSPDNQMIDKEFSKEISVLLIQVKTKLKNDSERKTIDSIIFIFKHVNKLDLLNKRAIFFYIREMTGLSAKQLTTNMATIKKIYKELRGDDVFGIFN